MKRALVNKEKIPLFSRSVLTNPLQRTLRSAVFFHCLFYTQNFFNICLSTHAIAGFTYNSVERAEFPAAGNFMPVRISWLDFCYAASWVVSAHVYHIISLSDQRSRMQASKKKPAQPFRFVSTAIGSLHFGLGTVKLASHRLAHELLYLLSLHPISYIAFTRANGLSRLSQSDHLSLLWESLYMFRQLKPATAWLGSICTQIKILQNALNVGYLRVFYAS